MYDGTQVLLLLLLGAVAYLIWKVNRLEQMVRDGKARRRVAEPVGDGKVIPILKDHIEPGPFKDGNKRPPEE